MTTPPILVRRLVLAPLLVAVELALLVAAGPLALVALIAGWITTEVGRQPWIVYEVMRVSDAVTGNDGLEVGFAALVAVYLGLGVAVAWLLRRLAATPPEREVAHR